MVKCALKPNVGGLERLGCLVLGGGVLLRGILTRRIGRTVIGGLLIYRGLTGTCRGYEALGLDTRSPAERAGG